MLKQIVLSIHIAIGVVLAHVFKDTPPIDERNATGDILEFPLFFGTVLFSMVAVGVVMSLER